MLQLHGGVGLGLGLGLLLEFYSVRHLMNGWNLKYTFSAEAFAISCYFKENYVLVAARDASLLNKTKNLKWSRKLINHTIWPENV